MRSTVPLAHTASAAPPTARALVPPRYQRLVEIALGLLTWLTISLPFWGTLLWPPLVVLFVLAFEVYWLVKAGRLGGLGLLGAWRLHRAQKIDWAGRLRAHPAAATIEHLVIIPTCGEATAILARTLDCLVAQDFPSDRIVVVLAFEERDPAARARAAALTARYGGCFRSLLTTFHPDLPGEVPGKAANLAWALRQALADPGLALGRDPRRTLLTVCDADSCLPPSYLSALTWTFLTHPQPTACFFQPAILFHANIWRLPPLARLLNTIHTVAQVGRLMDRRSLLNYSTYSLSLDLCLRAGAWDVDVIAEDSHMFFKAFFQLGGRVRVEPIFLPVLADAAESTSLWRTLANHYCQERRWAWGVADLPYILWHTVHGQSIPLRARLRRLFHYLEDHWSRPVHWFVLNLGPTVPFLLQPDFARSPWADLLQRASPVLLGLCGLGLGLAILVEMSLRPAPPSGRRLGHGLRELAAWLFLPVIALGLSALPALDAHTRLLLGARLRYDVTEKVPAPAVRPAGPVSRSL